MSKLYNSFRPNKYYRSKFQEAKYLLASEATDLQLESFGQLRDFIKQQYGDVCVGDGLRVYYSGTGNDLYVRPGEGWVDGIPILLKSGTDTVMNGGVLPTFTTVTDSSASSGDDGGKKISFHVGGTTTADSYGVVIEVTGELIKGSGVPETGAAVDPYLIGETLGEDTQLKERLIYKIHVVPIADLSSSPTFPLASNGYDYHYVNEISITPGVTELNVSSGPTVYSITDDGANCSITFLNATKKIPYATPDKEAYIFGQLIDSDGNNFTITDISYVGDNVTFLICREPDIADDVAKTSIPVITQGVPFRLIKRDHYVVDAGTGLPAGSRYLKIATVNPSNINGTITDNRTIVEFRNHDHDGTQGESSVLRPTQIVSTGSIAGTAISGTSVTSSGAVTAGSVASTGNITTSVGNITATAGNITAGGAISFGSIAVTPANLVGSAMSSTGADAIAATITSTGANAIANDMTAPSPTTGVNAIANTRTRTIGNPAGVGGIARGPGVGVESTNSTLWVDTGLSATITTSSAGRPVFITVVPSSSSSPCRISVGHMTGQPEDNMYYGRFQLVRDSGYGDITLQMWGMQLTVDATSVMSSMVMVPSGALTTIDTPSPNSTNAYRIQMSITSTYPSSLIGVQYSRLVVFEL